MSVDELGGRFPLDGSPIELDCNDHDNHLHGGNRGFDKRLWQAEAAEPMLLLHYRSLAGEEGYPGNVDVLVCYTLTDENEVRIDYDAVTDSPTPFSLTNHSYFNLMGEGNGTIESHILQISAEHYVPTHSDLTLTGHIEPVAGTAIDFRESAPPGDIVGGGRQIHGDNYLIDTHDDRGMFPVARLVAPEVGRVMDVTSNARSLQLYTGKFLANDKLKGKSGKTYGAFDGLCLECHGYPDGVNHPEIEDIILRPGTLFRQTTVYRFSTT